MNGLRDKIDFGRLPQHVAIIMDGNGRWAKSHGMPRVIGHKTGVSSVREISEACAEMGVKYLTLYTFSTENWNRPITEVNALMSLLVETIKHEIKTLNKNNIRLKTIGDLSQLPEKSRNALMEGIDQTKNNTRMTLVLALNYSSRSEIVKAARNISQMVANGEITPDQVNEQLFTNQLDTHDIPDPELLIRTSGELRISNYLLWQIAYAELYFTDVFWPDFRKDDLYKALFEYQQRERRFGKISEQLVNP